MFEVTSAFVVAGLGACLVLASPIRPVQPVVEGMDGVDRQFGEQAPEISPSTPIVTPPTSPTTPSGAAKIPAPLAQPLRRQQHGRSSHRPGPGRARWLGRAPPRARGSRWALGGRRLLPGVLHRR